MDDFRQRFWETFDRLSRDGSVGSHEPVPFVFPGEEGPVVRVGCGGEWIDTDG